jgi:hypothetical protein
MADGMHLGDEVEIVTDSFASVGVPSGAIGVIVDDWADGSNDVEVTDPQTGELVARFRAAEGEIRSYSGTVTVREPREHGLLFGRGDDLGAPPGDPPSATPKQFGRMPGTNNGPWFAPRTSPRRCGIHRRHSVGVARRTTERTDLPLARRSLIIRM